MSTRRTSTVTIQLLKPDVSPNSQKPKVSPCPALPHSGPFLPYTLVSLISKVFATAEFSSLPVQYHLPNYLQNSDSWNF